MCVKCWHLHILARCYRTISRIYIGMAFTVYLCYLVRLSLTVHVVGRRTTQSLGVCQAGMSAVVAVSNSIEYAALTH